MTQFRKVKKSTIADDSRKGFGAGKKQKITEFSKKSRLNMMVHMGMLKQTPEFWFDLTYADDVMEGLTQEQRKLKSSEDLHQLKQSCERSGIDMHGIWKREWKKRRSGKLKGEFLPHFHFVVWITGADSQVYIKSYFGIADSWLAITGTQGKYRISARKVLHHEKSYRFIKSQKQCRKYMQKYIQKGGDFESNESIGRSWGRVGDPLDQEPEQLVVNHSEMVLLKRMLRKFCKGIKRTVKYGLGFCLSHENTEFFVLIERSTIFRMLEYIRAGTLVEGVPF